MTGDRSITVRNYVAGETLPPALVTGYEKFRCDPEWIWVAESAGRPCAILVAAPAHIAILFIRLIAAAGAPPSTINALLRRALADAAGRGYPGYVSWLNPLLPSERALLSIIRDAGGVQLTDPQVICIGFTRAAAPSQEAA